MSTDFKKLTPREVRALAEANKLETATGALCPDYVKAGLLILPSTYADDFLRFASWNPEIFPVLEVIREKPVSSFLAPGTISAPPCRATASLLTARSPRM